METIPGDAYLTWAAGVGIGPDLCSPDSHQLLLLRSGPHARFWALPPEPAAWPQFTAALVSGLDEWDAGYLWPRSGVWPGPTRSPSHGESVRNRVLRGIGVPAGWAGAVRLTHDEAESLVAILCAYLATGGCSDDDLFFVPGHGRQLLQTDHHDVVHARCASQEQVLKLVAHMARAGYQLPSEPPDGTFKRPVWMGCGPT